MRMLADGDLVLLCPRCGGDYLHQIRVELFFRDEDAKEGVHVIADIEGYTADREVKGNPSPRRQGMRITFECELCEEGSPNSILDIYQHKGQTFLEQH